MGQKMQSAAGSLAGATATITGGASGIGLAIASRFAREGAAVTIVDLQPEGEQTAFAARRVHCDISDADDVVRAFVSTPNGAPCDILVNCAGIAHVGTAISTEPDDLDRLYRVNVRGSYLCARAVLPGMVERKHGVILNMASIAATAGLPDRFAYSITKGAVRSMTFSIARDYLAHGIRCNCISPARVHTPFVDGFLAKNYPGEEAAMMAKLAAAQPIGRMGEPDEVAALALYLCSDAASFITGADYPIDGGFMNLR